MTMLVISFDADELISPSAPCGRVKRMGKRPERRDFFFLRWERITVRTVARTPARASAVTQQHFS
jgi:hypothetical protein